jgi:diaminohydroxyphosphoribosylaminopyrimidine deaminase/5-amino-6-(5-phosphoribosylamino)uracil reductase
LAGAFLAAGMIDRVLAYVAPKLLGAGPLALADAGVSTVTAAHQFVIEEATMVGSDVRISAVPIR